MATHIWKGHTIEIRFLLQPRVCWIAGGFDVCIDGHDQFEPPPENEGRGTTTPFEISHNGRIVLGWVRSVGRVLALGTAYEVEVEGVPVATGLVRAENWYVPYSVLPALLAAFLYLLWRKLT